MRTFNRHRLVLPLLVALVTAGCAGDLSRREAATRKSYVDYAGEPIKEFFAWRIDGWTPVSRNQLIVWTGINEAFLLTVWDTCPDIDFATTVSLSTLMRTVTTFDKVAVGRQICPIREIRKVDIKRMKAEEKSAREGAARDAADRTAAPKPP
ncbi:MAG: hypothetical protein EBZ40_00465 [Gammaproteobacteria bacterium]|jgi:hypothetical protein|nr:hypothetical protein [Gammaproteobacteria bacterium]